MAVPLLLSRRFLPYFASQALGAFNDNFYRNALLLLITYHFARDSGDKVGWMIAACSALFVIPYFIFSATAGSLTDKYDKARLMRWLKWTELIIMCGAAIGFWLMNVWLLLGILLLLGTQAAFFGPVKYASIPTLLPPDELMKGNALVEAGTFVAILTGTLVGGWLILSAYGREVVSAGCILISGLGVFAAYRLPAMPAANPDLRIRRNMLADSYNTLRDGIRQQALRTPMLAVAWFWGVGTVFLANLPLYVKTTLAGDSTMVAALLATFTVGIALGSGLCVLIARGEVTLRSVWPGALLLAAYAADFAYTSSGLATGNGIPMRLIIDLLGIAIGAGLFVVPHYTLLQHRADPAARGRILAASNILNALFMVGLSAACGLLLHWQLPVWGALAVLGGLTPAWLWFARRAGS